MKPSKKESWGKMKQDIMVDGGAPITLYKITDKYGFTRITANNRMQWRVGKKNSAQNKGLHASIKPSLCTSDVIHAYKNLNAGILFNPGHGAYQNFRLFRCITDKIQVEDWDKVGVYTLEVIEEVGIPSWAIHEYDRVGLRTIGNVMIGINREDARSLMIDADQEVLKKIGCEFLAWSNNFMIDTSSTEYQKKIRDIYRDYRDDYGDNSRTYSILNGILAFSAMHDGFRDYYMSLLYSVRRLHKLDIYKIIDDIVVGLYDGIYDEAHKHVRQEEIA